MSGECWGVERWLVEEEEEEESFCRGGGGALKEANIFSGLGQPNKNTPDADVY